MKDGLDSAPSVVRPFKRGKNDMRLVRVPYTACLLLAILRLTLFPMPVRAGEQSAPEELLKMSIEKLMDIRVVSVARRPEKLSGTAAAVTVITAEDIRRSGATSIPEALRLAPGVEVAHIDANKWAISIRGFNGMFANKLLVLIDGRSVYTPLFSGTYWDVQDTLIEDIERIEVVRGPGGTLWGANAVNGVINIVTKHAKDTQGGRITAGGGNLERGFGSLRYGAKLGDAAWFRVYGKGFDRRAFEDAQGNAGFDGWRIPRGGLRLDWEPSGRDKVMLSGEGYKGHSRQSVLLSSLTAPFSRTVQDSVQVSGGFALGRWTHRFADDNELQIQAYFDRSVRDEAQLEERRNTWDFDLQHHFGWNNQTVSWGLGYRLSRDHIGNTFTVSFIPDHRNDPLYTAFAQDEIRLFDERLRLTLGSKFEHNRYTGFEYQPTGRALWRAQERHTLWAAVSRAVQTPSRSFSDIRTNSAVIPSRSPASPNPTVIRILGNPDQQSVDLMAYELGWRWEPRKDVSLDTAGFYNVYHKLRTSEPGTPFTEISPAPTHDVVPLIFGNQMHGHSYGVELTAKWQALDNWRLTADYTHLTLNMRLDAGSGDTTNVAKVEGNSPSQRVSLRSELSLPHNVEMDAALYHVGRLNFFDQEAKDFAPVAAYNRLDLRLGWRPLDDLELALGGKNLLDRRHFEFGDQQGVSATAVPRSYYGKLTWRF